MNQDQMQPPTDPSQEVDQDQMIVQFLQELEDRITKLEERVLKDEQEDTTDGQTTPNFGKKANKLYA